MPGMIGMFGRLDAARLEKALGKLLTLPGDFTETQALDDVGLACACRAPRAGTACSSYARDGRVAILLYGALFGESPHPHRLEAADLLEAAREGRLVEALADCDGSYAIAAVDLAGQRALVLADRLGAQPVYWAQGAGCLAFGPEVKAVLTMTGLAPRFAREGLLEFLTCGYGLGARTLFEGVHLLAPGTFLECDLRTGQASVRRYWALSFAREPRFERRASAEEALLDAILRSHRLYLSDDPPAHQVLLSGGLDSRGMLGALERIGRRPDRAVAWGLAQDIPFSDAAIAGQLARRFEVPFHFLAYGTSAFAETADDWAFRSELANDNMGWFGEGLGSLRDFYAHGAPVSFVGDEIWGNGGGVANEALVRFGALVPPRVPAAVAAVLRTEVAAEARAHHEASLATVMAPCTSPELCDRRDFLYLHGRCARFIASLGYYKEHATELRRPFLTRAVLAVTTRLPYRFRIYKNLYCSMLARFMPEVMAFPDNLASSLPDWSYDVRGDPRLRSFLLELLRFEELERGPLAELVDRPAFEAARDRFFGAAVAPLRQRAARFQALRRVVYLRSRVIQRAKALQRLRPRAEPPDRGGDFDALRRVALLVLLQRHLAELGCA